MNVFEFVDENINITIYLRLIAFTLIGGIIITALFKLVSFVSFVIEYVYCCYFPDHVYYTINLDYHWFGMVIEGKKRIEGKALKDPILNSTASKIVNDYESGKYVHITFVNEVDDAKYKVVLNDIKFYADIDEMISLNNGQDLLPELGTFLGFSDYVYDPVDAVNVYKTYYEEHEKYGMVTLHW